MVTEVFEILKRNAKNPKLYICLIFILLIITLLFPYIDANVFYHKRVADRVDILHSITELDLDIINQNEILKNEYDNILHEMDKQSNNSVVNIFVQEDNHTVQLIKFITGGALFWLIAPICIFSKNFKNFGQKLMAIIFVVIFGGILAIISKSIPTVINPYINYFAVPIFEIAVIGLFVTLGKKR